MKHFLAVLLLVFAALADGLAQSVQVYPVGEKTYFAEAGAPFDRRNIRDLPLPQAGTWHVILLNERGQVLRYVPPAAFLRPDGQPWGATPDEAVSAFLAAIPGASLGAAAVADRVRQLASAAQFSTATQDPVRWDGSDWVKRTGTAPTAGLSAIFQAGPAGTYYERRPDGAINVQWFGAVPGDGIDDGPAFNAALDYAASVSSFGYYWGAFGAVELYVPRGMYLINTQIRKAGLSNVQLTGAGKDVSVLYTSGQLTMLLLDASNYNWTFEKLGFLSTNSATGGNMRLVRLAANTQYTQFQACKFVLNNPHPSDKDIMLRADSAYFTTITNCVFRGTQSANPKRPYGTAVWSKNSNALNLSGNQFHTIARAYVSEGEDGSLMEGGNVEIFERAVTYLPLSSPDKAPTNNRIVGVRFEAYHYNPSSWYLPPADSVWTVYYGPGSRVNYVADATTFGYSDFYHPNRIGIVDASGNTSNRYPDNYGANRAYNRQTLITNGDLSAWASGFPVTWVKPFAAPAVTQITTGLPDEPGLVNALQIDCTAPQHGVRTSSFPMNPSLSNQKWVTYKFWLRRVGGTTGQFAVRAVNVTDGNVVTNNNAGLFVRAGFTFAQAFPQIDTWQCYTYRAQLDPSNTVTTTKQFALEIIQTGGTAISFQVAGMVVLAGEHLTIPDHYVAQGSTTVSALTVQNTNTQGMLMDGTGTNTNRIRVVTGTAGGASNLEIQSENTNRNVGLNLFPNGTATQAKMNLANASDRANYGSLFVQAAGALATVGSQNVGSPTTTVNQLAVTNLNVTVGTTTNSGHTFDVAGSVRMQQAVLYAPVTHTVSTAITGTMHHIFADATAGAITETLPTAVGRAGQVYLIKRVNGGSNTVTVATTGGLGQTIDGAATYVLSAQYKYVQVESDGANWLITAQN